MSVWKNTGRLEGTFKSDGTPPQVKTVAGEKAVVFGGKRHLVADFNAPYTVTADQPFSCVVRAYCTDIRDEGALIAWSTRPLNGLEIQYGNSAQTGAIGTGTDEQMGWTGGVPKAGTWHNLVYIYAGGKDGAMQAWCDAELRAEKKAALATKPGRPFVLGACQVEDGPNKLRYEHTIVGAIASVKVYDRVLSPLEVWKASGMDMPFPVSPKRDAEHGEIVTMLKWEPIQTGASYDIYVGTRHGDLIRAAQLEVARTVPDTAVFPTADLNCGDRWHYDTAGMVTLGERFAKAMLKLENERTESKP